MGSSLHTKKESYISTWKAVSLLLLLTLFALLPRILPPTSFTTTDEAAHWTERTANFLTALREGDLVATRQTYHPGVTTMWLAATGQVVGEAIHGAWDRVPFSVSRAFMRMPSGIVAALAVIAGYFMLRRLVSEQVACLGALLWATEPFLVAHARVMQTDSLLTSFMMMTLLTALLAFRIDEGPAGRDLPPRWGMLLGSGIMTGLATLTKSPALALLPIVGIIAFMSGRNATQFVRSVPIAPLLLWSLMIIFTWLIFYPAIWIEPLATIHLFSIGAASGTLDHEIGNFFLGQTVGDPGPLFYPVAIALRLTPWSMLGLGLLLIALVRGGISQAQRGVLLYLGLYLSFFMLAMTLGSKKLDRYVLPIFPVLAILSAFGLLWGAKAVSRWLSGYSKMIVLGVIAILSIFNLFYYHPYHLAYYNPLLGGGVVAARTILVGWGEGLDQAGAYIRAQPDGCDRPITMPIATFLLEPFVCSDVILDTSTHSQQAGYAVFYINQLQRDIGRQEYNRLVAQGLPKHTIHLYGIDYVYIFTLSSNNE
ncbi:ArnT family glycosyltransferase [Candidatus Viridilinea mediisalina]|uniref:Glycosyltransferase RgtA/B/C/D-like domain-containing protein n=1 Tax=Candidatus Viridilinea mediisalina TaxID=2024553 RepID=A0A2A6RK46_9CHLR|nr:glycosyltransferase family 39 protein [Candidatus Viridilinea mediisalina]PDW03238.1 hypothetical protein CJ255_09975 [Candidatus Viridilinea mediisalina]